MKLDTRDRWNIICGIYFRWRDTKSLGAGILFFIWHPDDWDKRGE